MFKTIYNKVKNSNYLIFFIFIIALSLRFLISIKGGQFFIVDELRYYSGHHLLSFISDFNFKEYIVYLLSGTAHTMFAMFASFCELVRYFILICFVDSGINAYELNNSTIGIEFSACVISTFSALNICLMYPIVKGIGGTKLQGIIACILLLFSNTNFYFSRHLIPYDISITLSLFSLLFLIKSNGNIKLIFSSGFLSGLSTLTYFGYWPLAVAIWLYSVISSFKTNVLKIKYGIICGLGGLTPIIIFQILGYTVDINFISGLLNFIVATGNNQMGDQGVSITAIFEYLWLSERLYLIFLLLFFFLTLIKFNFHKSFKLNHISIGVFFTIIITCILILSTEISDTFVLYGRTIKQIIPFLCLACSFSIYEIFRRLIHKKNYKLIFTSGFLLLTVSISNQLDVIRLTYPNEFKNKVRKQFPDFDETSSFIGKNVQKLENYTKNKEYIVVNAQYLVPPLNEVKELPIGKVIYQKEHPYNSFEPYQFLHYNKFERSLINSNKTSMILIKH